MLNRYAGTCHYCGGIVPIKGGTLWKSGKRWRIAHLACNEKQIPQVNVFRFNDGRVQTRNVNGLCIDAPCCGCCTF